MKQISALRRRQRELASSLLSTLGGYKQKAEPDTGSGGTSIFTFQSPSL